MNNSNPIRFQRKRVAALLASLALSGSTSGAIAAVLEEVIVTAQKRAESVQDVPIAMQAYTGDDLNVLGVQTAVDVTKLSPNMMISTQNPVSQAINIRGVGTNDFFGNATGSVGIYMDEVTMSAPSLGGLGTFDLERVEVLRGPQNSLFGRNTTGGAVNFISNKPEVGGDLDGFFRAVYGSHNRIEVEAAASFQLGDSAAIRISGKTYDRDGNFDNLADGGDDYGEKDRKSLRTTLVWEPSDLSQVIANFHYAKEDSEITPYRLIGLRAEGGSPEVFKQGPFPVPSGPQSEADWTTGYGGFNAQGSIVDTTDWQDIYRVGDNRHKVNATGGYIKLLQEFDFASFTGIVSYDKAETEFTMDLGGPGVSGSDITMINAQDQENEQYSVELRLTSSSDGPLRWVAGLYYFVEEATFSQNMGFGPFGFDFDNPAGPLPGQPLGGSFGLLFLTGSPYANQAGFSVAELDNEVISPYLHSEFDISDSLTLIFGLRYTDDTKEASSIISGNIDTSSLDRDTFRSEKVTWQLADGNPLCDLDGDGNLITLDNLGRPCSQDLSRDDLEFQEWGGKLGLDWRLDDNLMVYGSYSRGFRSGKYDIEFFHGPHTGFPIQDQDVETLDAFEIGFKSDLLDGSMQLNASMFYYLWNDQQLFIVDPLRGPTFTNIKESELLGAELEIKWAPADGWLVQAGLGWLDTEITDAGG